MTTQEIQQRIDSIRAHAVDYEMAHALEDELFGLFIRYVAEVGLADHDIAAKARLVLTTEEIQFARYTA